MALKVFDTSTAIKDKVAYRLQSVTYANAPAYVQALITQEMTSAMITLEAQVQWFSFVSPNATTNPVSVSAATAVCPDSWEPYYVSEVCLRVALNTQADTRIPTYTKQRNDDRATAFEHFDRLSMTYSPGTTTDAFVYTVQTVRNYCLAFCLRMPKAYMPAVASIDSTLDEVVKFLWNKAKWGFRRRQVTFRVTRTDFTAGVWTESTKIISSLTGIAATIPVGTRVYITAATSADGTVMADEYTVNANTTTQITLNNSIISNGTDATAVAGFYYTVDVNGLETSESFDSFATNYLHGLGTDGTSTQVRWCDGDNFAALRAESTIREGAPTAFRSVQIGPTAHSLLFWPVPNQSYQFRGEAVVRQPAVPSTASGTFSQFAAEFLPTMRRMVLARLLTSGGRPNAALNAEVNAEIESLFPGYQEVGSSDNRVEPTDVYGDIEDLGTGMNVGGII